MALPTTNVDQLTAITNDFFMPDVPDLVHNQNVFFEMISKNRRLAPGGATIDQPLLYQFTQDGAYFDYERGSTAAEDQVTRADYNWKLYRQRIVISEPEIDRNSGPEAVFSLLEAKTKGAGMAIRDALGTDLFTAGNGDSSRGVNSLQNLLGDATVPSGNLTSGGIDKSVAGNAFFRGTNFDYTTSTLGTADTLIQAWFAIVDGNIKPNLVISHPDALRDAQREITGTGGIATALERYVNTEQFKSGFVAYSFNGAPWSTDLHCPAAELFLLNMNFMHMTVHKKRDFQLKPFMQPEDQDVNIAWIKWMGNFTSSDPSRSGFMYT